MKANLSKGMKLMCQYLKLNGIKLVIHNSKNLAKTTHDIKQIYL